MIKPFAEVAAESNQATFERAVEQKNTDDIVEVPDKPVEDGSPMDDDDFEVVVGEEEVEEEAPVATKSDTGSDLLVTKLVEALAMNKAPVTPPVTARASLPVVNREEIKKTFNEKLHETDDPFSLVENAAQALVGNSLAEQSLQIQNLKKEQLKVDPYNAIAFENWNGEIEEVIAGLPAPQQVHPDAYEYALGQVKNKHFREIVDMEADKKVAAKVRPGPTASLSGNRTNATATKKPKKVFVSEADKQKAISYGISLKDYLRGQGKI